MKVFAFGEVLWDVYSNSEHIGGAPLNFAAHFKKCGGDASVITAVGDDDLGKKTVSEIKKMGIGTEYITVSEKETGKCLVTLDENQIPSYNLLSDVAYDCIESPIVISRGVLYFGTLALRGENNRKSLAKIIDSADFDDVFVDVNIRPPFYSDEVIKYALSNATIIKISDEELPVIMSALGREDKDLSCVATALSESFLKLKIIIITKGGDGSFVYECKNGKIHEYEAEKVSVVSTVGAGDSFSASFLAEYLRSADVKKALSLATKVSGYVVSKKEAIPEYDINNFM